MKKDTLNHAIEELKEELHGHLTFKFNPGCSLDEFCERNFANYTRERFEALALRVYYRNKAVITLYALDKGRQKQEDISFSKLPVKKFRSTAVSLSEMLNFISEFNFTLNAGNYPLNKMEVINK